MGPLVMHTYLENLKLQTQRNHTKAVEGSECNGQKGEDSGGATP